MEEQLLFTRIHDALDVPTPPGAYERLRTNLTKKPVRPFRWPALRMRTSTMGFRFAAGLVVVAIVVAAAAAAVAIHNSTNNLSPAGSRMSIQAYQKMVATDQANALATYSAPCNVGLHAGCAADATRATPVLAKWIRDLSSSAIPTRFVVINDEMLDHLRQSLAAQSQIVAASQRKDGPGMDQAFELAVFGEEWTNIAVPAITASHQVDMATYVNRVVINIHALDGCGAPCGFTPAAAGCATSSGLTCIDYSDTMGGSLAGFSADLVRYAAPGPLSAKDLTLQGDLHAADLDLLAMRGAAVSNDQIGFNSAIAQLTVLKAKIDQDAAKITG